MLHQEGAGFGTDTNIVTIYKKDGSITEFATTSKNEVAGKIIRRSRYAFKGR